MNLHENNWVIVLDMAENERDDFFETRDSIRLKLPLHSFSEFRETWRHAKTIARQEHIRLISSGDGSPEKWRWAMTDIPGENVLIQPPRWGNAAALLMTILEIQKQDPHARVTLLPAHYQVEKGDILLKAVEEALDSLSENGQHGILLGIPPNPLKDYPGGWILPYASQDHSPYSVMILTEEMSVTLATKLRRRGALWNSSILIASIDLFLFLYMMAEPTLVWPVLRKFDENGKASPGIEPYDFVPTKDFTRDILFPNPHLLQTLPVGPCGWSLLKMPYWKRPFFSKEKPDKHPLSPALQ